MGKIEEFMKEHGVNQVEMADLLGVDKSQVNRWVHGRKVPEYILRLLECLDDKEDQE